MFSLDILSHRMSEMGFFANDDDGCGFLGSVPMDRVRTLISMM